MRSAMKRLLRKTLGLLVPRSYFDLTGKFGVFCFIIAAWHVVVMRVFLNDHSTTLGFLVLDALLVGAAFVLLFLVGSWHQVTTLRALSERAYVDSLSGLLNRQTFLNRLGRRMRKARSGVLILFDADHFKQINDQYGHALGDRCIEAIGHRFNWHTRDSDLAGRIGGEEFAVFLSDVTEEHARAIATRLGMPVSFSDRNSQTHLTVTLSAGATFISPDRTLEEHLNDSDSALYVAKAAGRAQLRFSNRADAISLNGSRRTDPQPTIEPTKPSRSSIKLISR